MFSALKYIKNLEKVGFPREQAEAQVQLVIESYEENVATKSDIQDLRSEFSEFKSAMRQEFSEFRSEMRQEFAEFKSDILIKLGGMMVACFTLFTAILGILIKF